MKKLYLLIFFILLIHHSAVSQCTIENANFNSWQEVSELIEGDLGVRPDTTVFAPNFWLPFFRLFSIGFADIFTDLISGPDSTSLANNYLGLQRYAVDEDAEDYAVCMIPDRFTDFVDLITIFECTEDPTEISLDIKYEGDRNDELQILYISGEIDPFIAYLELESLDQLAELGIRAFAGGFLTQGPDELTNFRLSIDYTEGVVNNPDIPDTAMILIMARADSAEIANGAIGKYIIDNINLEIPAASTLVRQPDFFKVFPNPASTIMEIRLDEASEVFYEVSNNLGQRVLTGRLFGQGSIDVSYLTPGMYTLRVDDGKRFNAQQIIITR